MKLEKIEVEGLFHEYNYVIPLNTDERITIIHGLNSTGKTTILRLLADFFDPLRSNYIETQRIPYHIIRLSIKNSYKINIYKTFFFLASQSLKDKNYEIFLTGEDIYRDKRIFVEIISPKKEESSVVYSFDGNIFRKYQYPQTELDNIRIAEIKRNIETDIQRLDFFRKISADMDDHYEGTDNKEITDIETSFSIINEEIENMETQQKTQTVILEENRKILREYQSILEENGEDLIEFQSLIPRQMAFPTDTVTEEITKIEMEVNERNEQLKYKKIEFAQLKDLRNQLVHKPSTIREINVPTFPNGEKIIFPILFLDTSRNLSIENISDLFFENLNSRSFWRRFDPFKKIIETFLHNKIVGDYKFAEGELKIFNKKRKSHIRHQFLSTGEKQIITIFLDLIFKTPDGCLVLIDEPELSLHISWQIRFIEKLKEVLDLEDKKNVQVVIATHSPQIIHDRWDLTVGLGDSE